MDRKLSRSSSLRERFEDAGEKFQKTLTIGREAVMDISSFVDPATVTESAERVLKEEQVNSQYFVSGGNTCRFLH